MAADSAPAPPVPWRERWRRWRREIAVLRWADLGIRRVQRRRAPALPTWWNTVERVGLGLVALAFLLGCLFVGPLFVASWFRRHTNAPSGTVGCVLVLMLLGMIVRRCTQPHGLATHRGAELILRSPVSRRALAGWWLRRSLLGVALGFIPLHLFTVAWVHGVGVEWPAWLAAIPTWMATCMAVVGLDACITGWLWHGRRARRPVVAWTAGILFSIGCFVGLLSLVPRAGGTVGGAAFWAVADGAAWCTWPFTAALVADAPGWPHLAALAAGLALLAAGFAVWPRARTEHLLGLSGSGARPAAPVHRVRRHRKRHGWPPPFGRGATALAWCHLTAMSTRSHPVTQAIAALTFLAIGVGVGLATVSAAQSSRFALGPGELVVGLGFTYCLCGVAVLAAAGLGEDGQGGLFDKRLRTTWLLRYPIPPRRLLRTEMLMPMGYATVFLVCTTLPAGILAPRTLPGILIGWLSAWALMAAVCMGRATVRLIWHHDAAKGCTGALLDFAARLLPVVAGAAAGVLTGLATRSLLAGAVAAGVPGLLLAGGLWPLALRLLVRAEITDAGGGDR